ncbi:unnamed protein product [Cuscuta campestris]|uniref:Uncharacterized protein n=1 Tax=Cuscuta campestris TaxID=132261 RepID=A0A484KGC9_9ASTE|nr:unnamed protein product [Cuscuta campestris]
MSQDKSREFLHSGNDRDKFKFFFKATLLQQVEDLLKGIETHIGNADSLIDELEKLISPILRELQELQAKIKSMEHIEEISLQVEVLRKKLAWSWVYNVDTQLQEKSELIKKLQGRIPLCQSRIDQCLAKKKSLFISSCRFTKWSNQLQVRNLESGFGEEKEEMRKAVFFPILSPCELSLLPCPLSVSIIKSTQKLNIKSFQMHVKHQIDLELRDDDGYRPSRYLNSWTATKGVEKTGKGLMS